MFAASATVGAVEAGESFTAPLFFALIVDVVSTAVITVTSAFIQEFGHTSSHKNQPQGETGATGGAPIAPPVPSGSMDYDFETPCCTPEMIMYPINKRASSPLETPKPKRENSRLRSDERTVVHTGPSHTADWCRDFSGIQRTRVNPVTGRIIGYKGIRRKRALSPTSKYSSFWRDQKYLKPSLHAARSSGIWDSARR